MGNYKRRYKRKNKRNGLGKVKRDVKWLKKNVEFKFADLTDTTVEASTSGILSFLNGLAQGVGQDERIGDEVAARRISVRGTVVLGPTPTDCTVRLMLVRQKSGHGGTAGVTELLQGGLFVHSFRNMARKTEWKVYGDHTFTMDTSQHARVPFKFDFKLNHQARYSGTGLTQAEMQMNGIFLVTISSNAAGATAPDITFSSRYYYCDS